MKLRISSKTELLELLERIPRFRVKEVELNQVFVKNVYIVFMINP